MARCFLVGLQCLTPQGIKYYFDKEARNILCPHSGILPELRPSRLFSASGRLRTAYRARHQPATGSKMPTRVRTVSEAVISYFEEAGLLPPGGYVR